MSALSSIRVLDLSRVLAGPVCTQILGDLGADIIKIEKPFAGDDTRFWGPPFLKDAAGRDTTESAYYLSANRNKKSVAIDIARPEGAALVAKLAARSDILIENFKVGGLKKYGLDYETLSQSCPRLIYASITGFGQNGPLSSEPGYDFLIQGMSGFMASTGDPNGMPTKAGVAISDYVTGLYAGIGILAALNARHATGRGQHIDAALLDCSLAMMTNIAQYYLTSGQAAPRLGNAHSTIVPYQAFATAGGHIIIAVGNDKQFAALARACGHPEWADDERFKTNPARVAHRAEMIAALTPVLMTRSTGAWLDVFRDADVPCGPIHTMAQAFTQPQAQARGMVASMEHPLSPAPVQLVASPLKMSEDPPANRLPPPTLGQHTREVLMEQLSLADSDITALARNKIIQI